MSLFLDMAANQGTLGDKLVQKIKPSFTALGLELNQFAVENVSLPEQLQTILNQRIGMNMVGDMGRYAQFTAAESLPIAAANTSGAADIGIGLGAGAAVGQVMLGSLKAASMGSALPSAAPAPRFCTQCGNSIPLDAKFCPQCGRQQ
jgi:membrane protease subunit (stomatin/prohibitin family)